MHFGSRSLAQWAALLSATTATPVSPPTPPHAPLTWAARVALGRAGVAQPRHLPQPAPPPPAVTHPPSPPSIPAAPPAPSPPPSPRVSPSPLPSSPPAPQPTLPAAISSTAPPTTLPSSAREQPAPDASSSPPSRPDVGAAAIPSIRLASSAGSLPGARSPAGSSVGGGGVQHPRPDVASSSTDTWSPPAPAASTPPAPTKRRRRPPRAQTPVIAPAPLPGRALRGLVNCGNSCFINVVLQALLACEPFRRLLLRCREIGVGKVVSGEKESLLGKFVRLAGEMTVSDQAVGMNGHASVNGGSKGGGGAGSPRYGVNGHGVKGGVNGVGGKGSGGKGRKENGFLAEEPLLPDFFYDVFPGSSGGGAATGKAGSGGSQEDAEEFLSFVLNQLHEELVELEKHADPEDDFEHVNGKQNGRISPVTANGVVATGKSPSVGNGVWNGSHASLIGDSAEKGVWEEMTRKGKTVEIRGGDFAQSGITDIFGGALRSEVKRGRAKPSVTREPFFRLSLDIESGMIRDVEHALTAYFEPEQLEGYTVEIARGRGQETVDARKQVLLHTAPQVLILHLKRFSHNTVTGALNKVSRQMPFPEILEVPSQVVYGGGARRSYGLTAVVTHIGKELAGGHYTCDVRWDDESSETWVTCDDSKVGRTTLPKVVRKQAYLLFYSLRTHSGNPSAHRW